MLYDARERTFYGAILGNTMWGLGLVVFEPPAREAALDIMWYQKIKTHILDISNAIKKYTVYSLSSLGDMKTRTENKKDKPYPNCKNIKDFFCRNYREKKFFKKFFEKMKSALRLWEDMLESNK